MNSNVVAAHVRQTFSYHFPVYWFSQELSENACRANGIQKGGGGLMSLKKIAEMVGVSPSTVSRVLNDRSSSCASEAIKQKIWEAAHEIDYVPNSAARRLKLGETQTAPTLRLAVVLARTESLQQDPFFRELYRELEIEILKEGYSLTDTLTAAQTENISPGQYDGIIILGRCFSSLLQTLGECTRNLVGIWRNPINYEIDEVVCDGREAARMAVTYLIEKGHKKIGYIGDCSNENRYVGYTETLILHQLPLDYECVVSTDHTEQTGYEAMLQIRKVSDMTAVLCANDISAVGALRALREHRVSDRRKISVIAIDNIEEAQSTRPMLTTVHIPRRDMAHMALQILTDRIRRGHTEKMRVEFPCQIVERESVYKNEA